MQSLNFVAGGEGWETVKLDGVVIGHLVFSNLYDPKCQFKPLTSASSLCLRLGLMNFYHYAIETESLPTARDLVKKIIRRG